MRGFEPNSENRRQKTASWWAGIFVMALLLSVEFASVSRAGGFRSPEACQGSTGEAHLNCLYEYIGIPDNDPKTVQPPTNAEQDMLEQLRDQRDRVEGRPSAAGVLHERQNGRSQVRPPAGAPFPQAQSPAPSFHSPEECRAYTGPAHLNCLYAYIELQQGKTGKIEEELRAQTSMIGQLRDQVDRQAAARDDLHRRLAERDSSASSTVQTYIPAPLYPPYVYPGYYGYLGYSLPGVSLYLGVPRFYYGRPFYGPRFFGPRFYGPRFYGHRRW
ncbi:MAG TPA: hypothetical protein VJ692_13750 [Nitrospiraceae bacterium]|nr:hypothetical protein [Nitrospiraceae bacterium]